MHRIRSGFLALAATAGVLLGASVVVTPATATSVTFNFSGPTGSIVQSDFQVNPPITLPGGIQGTFTFDNSTGAVSAFSTNLLNNVPAIVYNTHLDAGASAVTVFNDTPVGGGNFRDRWELSAAATGSPIGSFTPFRFEIQLDQVNSSPSLFSSNAVQNPPSLGSGLTGIKWRVLFNDTGTGLASVSGTLSTLALTAVPLPPAVILFGAGLVALIGLGARNWQRKTVGGMRLEA